MDMKKGYDVLCDWCYDYDIDLSQEGDYGANTHDFAVLTARFLCKKHEAEIVLRKKTEEEIRKLAYLSNFDNVSKREKYAETSKDRLRGNYFFTYLEKKLINRLSTQIAYTEIKKPLVLLARKGDQKALALYLTLEKPEKWDGELTLKAKEIATKNIKTPEEWEVVASLSFHNKILKDFENMSEIAISLDQNYHDAYDACEWKNERVYNLCMKAFFEQSKVYLNSPYAEAMQKAMLGYYAKYFQRFPYATYLDDYLRLQYETKDFLTDKNAFKEFSKGEYHSSCELSEILGRLKLEKKQSYDFKNKKFNLQEAFEILSKMADEYYSGCDESVLDRLAVARNLVFYSNVDNLCDTKKKVANQKQGYKILNQIAHRRFLNAELEDLETNKNKTPNLIFGAYSLEKEC